MRTWEPITGFAARLSLGRPEAVLANGVKAAAVAVPVARALGIPVAWAKHDFSFDRRLARPLAALADRLIVTSPAVALATRRADYTVIPPPLPASAPAGRIEARRFWAERGVHIAEGRSTLVTVGRLVPYKGVDTAIRALAERAADPWDLVVVGEDGRSSPGERERLRALARGLGLEERVRFAGATPEAGRWLAAFDAAAILTRQDERGFGREGYSIVALEALRAGVPVIGSADSPVLARLASRAGRVVPSRDAAATAGALAALRDPEARRAAASAGATLLADHPTAAACADRLAATLSEAASRPGAGLADGPPVSVVTSVRNEEMVVEDLAERIAAQLGPGDELIVVDDGSTDQTAAVAEQWALRDERVRVLRQPPGNIAMARNRGVRAAQNDVLVGTDAGCTPVPGWLDALRMPFAELSAPDLVVGVYRATGRTVVQQAMTVALYADPDELRRRGPFTRAYSRLFGHAFDPCRPEGRSFAYRREAWQAAGGFDEQLRTTEDAAFGRDIAATGRRCLLAVDAEVLWGQRSTLRGTARMYHGYGYGGAHSRNRLLIARDLTRVAAYLLALPGLIWGGRGVRAGIGAGTVVYLSLPLARVLRRGVSPLVVPLIPLVVALKDLAKAAGCLDGLIRSPLTSRLSALRCARRPGSGR